MTEKKPPKIIQANAKKDETVLDIDQSNKNPTQTSADNANQEQTLAKNANETKEKSSKKHEENKKVDEAENQDENSPKKKHKHKKKQQETEDSKSCIKKCSCRNIKCCPYFPRCCPLPLMNCLQILAALDMIVTFVNIATWIFFHQYDPFAVNLAERSNITTTKDEFDRNGFDSTTTAKNTFDVDEFHETTTSRFGVEGNPYGEGDGNNVKYSKIGYAFRQYQQEVENSCGRKYYSDYLSGFSLTITAKVFEDLLNLTYFSELVYQFIDVAILATTCCFFEYTSGRMFLIIIWNLELLPVLAKIYLIVESRSQRLCIFQYGLGKTFRGQNAIIFLHFMPLMIFRGYFFIVFTYFVASMLELGNLEHQTRIQVTTLHEYVTRHEEYLRMNRNRDVSSSEDDDAEHV